ncbi:DUF4179 domain-containing protein [Lederbergia lenta]|uniref:DUF4179 domain-containing protein n=1 Tax=Lederbergia lenta TaxID=1467 RepID=A0A2X4WKM7_LEDLE|nr:DUF4179 domain-containing protein [Lederbergia lenta]MEC2326205.1 DUF4179 domain-containing protein [Lederbergia lenta]SQI63671.1 Uncharacterised protein [Lederbergia lenta]
MQKNLFKDIEVPNEEVLLAIDKGIERGEKARHKNNKHRGVFKRTSFFTSAAAAMIIASGFIFSPVANVLAQVPILGSIYEKYQMPIGQELASDHLLTEINETVEDQGVSMSITSIFYDGQYIGLTFKAIGENLADSIGGEVAPESGYAYEMFDRKDETTWWGGSMGALTKQDNGYTGAMILENPNTDSVDSLTLPITFTNIAGVQGEWSFNLSVEKLPAKEIHIAQSVSSMSEAYRIHFDKIVVGQTNATLSYEVLDAADIEGEQLELNILDSKGLSISTNSITDSKVIFEIDRKKTDFVSVEPIYKIGTKEIKLDTLKIDFK